MKLVAALSVICLATVLPPAHAGIISSVGSALFGSTPDVCAQCKCTEADPYTIDCSDLSLTSTYAASETWPQNKTNIQLNYEQNSLVQVAPLPALDIRDISFQHNDVTGIEDGAFQALPYLRRLDLSHNKLTRESLTERTFRGQFSADDYQPIPLQVLDLSYNNIHSIYEEVFSHFSSLLELDLSHNDLAVLDSHTILAITYLPKLRTLRLAGCGLQTLPLGLLHSLITLRTLDLGENQLNAVPQDLYNSHAIRSLRLDGNPIKVVDEDSFNGMTQLETLNLSSMPELEYIGERSFSTLVELKTLRCRNNPSLWSISPHVFAGMETSRGLFPLRELFLSGNNLTTLSEAMVPFWDQLLLLQLHENPWSCDCRLAWMATKLLPELEEVDPQAADRILCASPAELAGVAVVRAGDTPEALVCPAEVPPPWARGNGSGSTLAAALTIGGLVIVVGTGIVGYLFWRREKIRQMYRAKQQIRYRRAAMDEEVDVDDVRPTVTA